MGGNESDIIKILINLKLKTVILFESYFGNTEQIARAIGKSLTKNNEVQVLNISDVAWNDVTDTKILIVGSATRGFRPCKQTNRFLKSIPAKGLHGVKVAAFDTRMSLPEIESKALRFIVKTGGYAAKQIAKALKNKGGDLIVQAEGFLVSGEKGPLVEGELNRAANWAEQIVISSAADGVKAAMGLVLK
jgi:flavodoxin I